MANEPKTGQTHSCPYCEAEIAEAAFPYCEACGLQAVSCPKCGISVAKERETCPNCGADIKKGAAEGG